MTTIQEANVAHLRAIDPERIEVSAALTPAQYSCDTDSHHGKGVCYLRAEGGLRVDVLCLACAVIVAQGWLASQICDRVSVVVAQ
jgi:hypothetical protein